MLPRFILLLSLGGVATASASAPLSGDWQIGSSVVTISQAGDHLRAVWKRPAAGCKPGATWWEGKIENGNQIRGQRYPCTGDVLEEPLVADILEDGSAINVQIPDIGGTTLLTPVK